MAERLNLLDTTVPRAGVMRQAELEEKTVRDAAAMRLPPQTLDVDASGASSIRLVIDDPLGLIASGQCGIRLDSEISEDGGATWRPHGIDAFYPGQGPSPKTGEYYIEERAMQYARVRDESGHAIITATPGVFPSGWRFRWHWRQTALARIGLHADVER